MTLATLHDAPRAPRTAHSAPEPAKASHGPFTLPHFLAWASDLILDTDESWHPEPFQEAFLEDVFSGRPECWLVVPEGNGKTTLIAGLALYHTEFRPFAIVPVAASSREQAEIVYQQAQGFVVRSPRMYQSALSSMASVMGKRKLDVPRFLCLPGHRRIVHHAGGRIQVMAADDRTGDGGIPTLAITDELHRHRDLALYRTWAGKLLKRQGQIVAISTAGEFGSDFEKTRTKIRQSATDVERDGAFIRAVSPRLVLHEWAVPEDADVEDFAIVKAANPFSGITVEALAEKFESPTMTLDRWKRFVCNVPNRGSKAAITEAEWAGAKSDEEIPPGEPVSVGIDVGWQYDTTSLVPLWLRDDKFHLFGPATVLVPPRDGTMLDPAKLEMALTDIHTRNPIATVVMDPSKAQQFGQWIESELGIPVIIRTTANVAAAEDYQRFMEGLRLGVLHHSGDTALTSHALNAVARWTATETIRFDRPVEGRISGDQDRRVIDALSAAAMVYSVATTTVIEPEFTAGVAFA